MLSICGVRFLSLKSKNITFNQPTVIHLSPSPPKSHFPIPLNGAHILFRWKMQICSQVPRSPGTLPFPPPPADYALMQSGRAFAAPPPDCLLMQSSVIDVIGQTGEARGRAATASLPLRRRWPLLPQLVERGEAGSLMPFSYSVILTECTPRQKLRTTCNNL